MDIYSQITGNKIKTVLIMAFFIGLLTVFFYLMGQYFGNGQGYMLFGFIFSLVSGVSSYFFSDKIVLTMSGAKPASKEEYFDFYTVTENLSIAAGIPMPKLYVIEDEALNAFATGRNPKHAVVAATTGILKTLKRAELEGVIAHELSHIRNYDILVMTIVSVLVGTIAYAVDLAMRMMWFGGNDDRDSKSGALGIVLFLVLLIVMPIIATLIQFAVSRRREYLADASGALLTRNPEGLASALEKISGDPQIMRHASTATAHMYISNPFKKGTRAATWLTNLFSTHPPVTERIRILRSSEG
jgi:heat shock protein HtpX